jgi:late competence protein required for DNA uptake (superfamily II DNA/RNA helicase)
MGRYRNKPRSDSNNNGLLMRLLGYALTTFVIPFIINMIRKKLGDQQRLLCNKCHGKLQVIDKEGNLYCKNCKMIKMNHH